MTALLGGHVDMIWANASEFGAQYDAKMVIPLVVAQETRFPRYKDVPTFKENGLDVIFQFYRGVVAPPRIPADVIAYYEGMMKKLNDSQAWKEQYLDKYFLNPAWQGHKEFTKTVADSEVVFEETLESAERVGEHLTLITGERVEPAAARERGHEPAGAFLDHQPQRFMESIKVRRAEPMPP